MGQQARPSCSPNRRHQLNCRYCLLRGWPPPLQADYHAEKFRAFPHVDSPARLIKEIVKPPPKRSGGAAAAGGQQQQQQQQE